MKIIEMRMKSKQIIAEYQTKNIFVVVDEEVGHHQVTNVISVDSKVAKVQAGEFIRELRIDSSSVVLILTE
jgi:hypothetical protein